MTETNCPICNPQTETDILAGQIAALDEKLNRLLAGLESALDEIERRLAALEPPEE